MFSVPCQASRAVLRGLGVTLILLGCLDVLSGVVCLPICLSPVKYVCGAIWTGAIIVLTGVVGIIAARGERRRAWLATFMVLSVISTVVSFAGWSAAVAAMSADTVIYYNSLHSTYADQKTTTLAMTVFEEKHNLGVFAQPNVSSPIANDIGITEEEYLASMSLQSLALVLSFIEMVLAFASAIVSICSLRTRQHIPGAVVYQTAAQQVVVLRQGFHLEQRRDGSFVVVHSNTGGHQVDSRYRPEMEQVSTRHGVVSRNAPSTHHHHHDSRLVTIQIGDANDSQPRIPDVTSHHHQLATAPPVGQYDAPPAYSAVIDTSEIPLNL